jgi:hypothetical protein
LDFQNAFNTVDRNRILQKLFGIAQAYPITLR